MAKHPAIEQLEATLAFLEGKEQALKGKLRTIDQQIAGLQVRRARVERIRGCIKGAVDRIRQALEVTAEVNFDENGDE